MLASPNQFEGPRADFEKANNEKEKMGMKVACLLKTSQVWFMGGGGEMVRSCEGEDKAGGRRFDVNQNGKSRERERQRKIKIRIKPKMALIASNVPKRGATVSQEHRECSRRHPK